MKITVDNNVSHMNQKEQDRKLGIAALTAGGVSPLLATSVPVAGAALPLWVVAAVAFPAAAFFFCRAQRG